MRELMRQANMKVPAFSQRTGVSVRHLHYILHCERGVSAEILENIAKAFGLEGYHLMMPDFRPDILKNGGFDRIYHAYVDSDDAGRHVLQTTADFVVSQHKGAAPNDPNEKNNTRSGG